MLLDEVGAHSTSLRALWVCLHLWLTLRQALKYVLLDILELACSLSLLVDDDCGRSLLYYGVLGEEWDLDGPSH